MRTGYDEDMNPDLIDGIHAAARPMVGKNVEQAHAGRGDRETFRSDADRLSPCLGQSRLDARQQFLSQLRAGSGAFRLVRALGKQGSEAGVHMRIWAPFTWDWAMYRGWYKGKREWGNAKVPWEFCLAEWDSQFLGDRAFHISEAEEEANLRWEAEHFRTSDGWFRWDYPQSLDSKVFDHATK